MNLYTSLTLRYLKQNKRRTLVTIIGIILATALICGIGNICTSFMDYQMRNEIQSNGSFYVTFNNIDKEKADTIVSTFSYNTQCSERILLGQSKLFYFAVFAQASYSIPAPIVKSGWI